jgi:pyruvate,orthophosphate dikinase
MRFVRQFGGGTAEGRAKDKALLGGKGANLAEMASLGLPVPPGFTITTEVCRLVMVNGAGNYPGELAGEVKQALAKVEELTKTTFGDAKNPLLVSVRSGAPASMPGMMDTILNLGLNDETVEALAKQSGNARFAWDCYRRFVAMYGEVVLGVTAHDESEPEPFDVILDDVKRKHRANRDQDLKEDALREAVALFKAEVQKRTGAPFPDDVGTQLWGAIGAVFRSWDNARADAYRKMYGIPASMGTAVNVQAMVFGNLGDDCATGVAFTRNPATGTPELYGEFLTNAQGEDVVAGIRTPESIAELGKKQPVAYEELVRVAKLLEDHFRDMQDLEFTIQKGQLFMLQTRGGKRTGKAMVKVAVDLVAEGKLTPNEAVMRIDPGKLDEVLHPTIDPKARPHAVGKGLPASPGAAIGRIVFTASAAEEWASRGERVILVRTDTSPEDIHGMKAAVGILTARGGMTSHSAVVARGMGKCCVTACTSLRVDAPKKSALFIANATQKEIRLKEGDTITLDGSTGEVFLGTAPLVPAQLGNELGTLMGWVDAVRTLKVRTNADTPNDARTARSFGAEGIGLCRTEHMFFQPERILAVREMILADDEKGRRAALAKILPMQKSDFVELFRVMDGLPVTIRLLDPPLHEFLPHTQKDIDEVAAEMNVSAQTIAAKTAELTETNPMLGHRGCRLGITFPEIYEIQAQAIGEAAREAAAAGVSVSPEIMIPLVMVAEELRRLRELVATAFDKALDGAAIPYTIGTMIELPRACVIADRIAEHADFFSFGTNDLTQTTFGLSRDDAGRFLPSYVDGGVIPVDPFVVLDQDGVGALIELGVRGGRAVRPKLKVGICGEHGGEPSSVEFCHRAGFDYVSCSPFRVPIARVAAARAALQGSSPGERRARSNAEGDAKVDDKPGERRARSSAEGDAKVDDKPGERRARSSAEGDAKVDDK